MNDQKHLEYKVTFKRDKENKILFNEDGIPKVDTKELTKRGHVMITPQEAAHYNRRTSVHSGIFYELDKENPGNLQDGKDLKKMNKEELSAYILEKGYEIDTTQTKAAIVAAIEQLENEKI